MAVAGVENVSAMDSSILLESRMPSSSSSGQNSNQGRWSSRPILQMWRELEDEFLASRTGERIEVRIRSGTSDGPSSGLSSSSSPQSPENQNNLGLQGSNENVSEDVMTSQTEQEDHRSITSDQSLDLGETERERVREIIRDWMSTGRNGLASGGPNINSSPRAQLLGQTEIERVRAVREWIQMACERKDHSGGNSEEQVAEIGSQIERVRDGLGLDNHEVQTSKKRDIRVLCGRQALVDLLNKMEQERKRELQGLLESCPVRNFAFRNRIQSVLRIRLLQNSGSAENNRNNTAADSELGFLRQRQTVSGLREGFLSRMQSNVQENDHPGILSRTDTIASRGNETQANSSAVVVDREYDKVDPSNKCSRSGPSSIITENACDSEINLLGSEGRTEVSPIPDVGDDEEETVNDGVTLTTPVSNESGIQKGITTESPGARNREQIELEETNQVHPDAVNEDLQLHESFSNPQTSEVAGISGPEDISGTNQPVNTQDASRHENAENAVLEETHQVIHEHHIHGDEDQDQHAVLPHSVGVEDPGSVDSHAWDSSTQGGEEVAEDDTQEWIGDSSFSEWRDESQPELDQDEWRDDASDDPSHDNTNENEGREQSQLEESFWHEGGTQQTLEHWSPLALETGASYSDDDNAHNIELRELLSRRRVSSLLSSGFRESLDQLIQSYVERQSHTPDDWELHEMLPTRFEVHDGDRVDVNQNEDSSDVDAQTDILGSTSAVPSNRTWEQQFHDIPWSRDMHQPPGTVLEMINDLRIEMIRLQQRMNHMQGMLEACVDIQLELQRAVRQEVSAALNRTINPSESDEVSSISGSKLDWVRKGICCICCVSNIDSLLYRCGHMCACAKCAGILLEGKGKCPMCKAPVVEVIRAYTLQ